MSKRNREILRKVAGIKKSLRKPYGKAQRDEFNDVVEFEMLHSRAAIMTAVLALEGKGVHAHVAISLRGADARLARVQETLQALRKGAPIVTHESGYRRAP